MNLTKQDQLILEMVAFDKGMAKQIQHFIKVYDFARLLGQMESLSACEQQVLETAAIVHDIGIRPSLDLYGDSVGKHQEELGPAPARDMLQRLQYTEEVIDRVCYLVAHHHTYSHIEGKDYQLLVEADFLVNLYEDAEPEDVVNHVEKNIFKSESGKKILRQMFLQK
jgi:HD superfamily phosphodiesterase